jgi:hypothetical protein
MLTQSEQTVLEIVTFQLAAGVSAEQMLSAADAMQPWVARQPGFAGRQLARTETGWVDVVTWDTLAYAQAAAQLFMSEPLAMQFGQLLDPASIVMQHATRARHW